MIIDGHNHPDWHGYNFNRIIENMNAYEITKMCLLSWECPSNEYDPNFIKYIPSALHPNGPIPFERCLAYHEKAPDRFILGYAPDPRKPEAEDQMRAAIEVHGVKLCGELKVRMMYDNPDALRLYRLCAEYNIPVLLHIDYEIETGVTYPRPNYWYGGGIEALERVLIACPETNFIGHAPGFWAHLDGQIESLQESYPSGKIKPGGKLVTLLQTYSNLYCDISANSGLNALKRDVDFAQEFIQNFSTRILFGRDFFDNLHQEFLKSLNLDTQILNKIFYQNFSTVVLKENF